MNHEFIDLFVSKEKQFSVGQDSISGVYYVSFPQITNNRQSELEVYFEIPSKWIDIAKSDPAQLEWYVDECMKGEHFGLKIARHT
jgi:hypothetical protein